MRHNYMIIFNIRRSKLSFLRRKVQTPSSFVSGKKSSHLPSEQDEPPEQSQSQNRTSPRNRVSLRTGAAVGTGGIDHDR